MKKVRCFFATIAIALVVALSGPLLQGMGSMASAATSWHASSASSAFVVGQLTRSVASKGNWPCPGAGAEDC